MSRGLSSGAGLWAACIKNPRLDVLCSLPYHRARFIRQRRAGHELRFTEYGWLLRLAMKRVRLPRHPFSPSSARAALPSPACTGDSTGLSSEDAMNKQAADEMNALCREIRQDENALVKRLEIDMARILGFAPKQDKADEVKS